MRLKVFPLQPPSKSTNSLDGPNTFSSEQTLPRAWSRRPYEAHCRGWTGTPQNNPYPALATGTH